MEGCVVCTPSGQELSKGLLQGKGHLTVTDLNTRYNVNEIGPLLVVSKLEDKPSHVLFRCFASVLADSELPSAQDISHIEEVGIDIFASGKHRSNLIVPGTARCFGVGLHAAQTPPKGSSEAVKLTVSSVREYARIVMEADSTETALWKYGANSGGVGELIESLYGSRQAHLRDAMVSLYNIQRSDSTPLETTFAITPGKNATGVVATAMKPSSITAHFDDDCHLCGILRPRERNGINPLDATFSFPDMGLNIALLPSTGIWYDPTAVSHHQVVHDNVIDVCHNARSVYSSSNSVDSCEINVNAEEVWTVGYYTTRKTLNGVLKTVDTLRRGRRMNKNETMEYGTGNDIFSDGLP